MAKYEDKLLDHNFDGIQEYDNPLPGWWVYLFIFTMIWGGLYLFYYHISGEGPSSSEEYAQEIREYKTEFAALIAAEQNVDWDNPDFKVFTESAKLQKGEDLYKKNCVSCHGALGEGGIGPNLTDPNWIHGGGMNNISRTIAKGVPEKGMLSWKNTMKKDDILSIASFVLTLEGTNPPNGKAPQGDVWSGE